MRDLNYKIYLLLTFKGRYLMKKYFNIIILLLFTISLVLTLSSKLTQGYILKSVNRNHYYYSGYLIADSIEHENFIYCISPANQYFPDTFKVIKLSKDTGSIIDSLILTTPNYYTKLDRIICINNYLHITGWCSNTFNVTHPIKIKVPCNLAASYTTIISTYTPPENTDNCRTDMDSSGNLFFGFGISNYVTVVKLASDNLSPMTGASIASNGVIFQDIDVEGDYIYILLSKCEGGPYIDYIYKFGLVFNFIKSIPTLSTYDSIPRSNIEVKEDTLILTQHLHWVNPNQTSNTLTIIVYNSDTLLKDRAYSFMYYGKRIIYDDIDIFDGDVYYSANIEDAAQSWVDLIAVSADEYNIRDMVSYTKRSKDDFPTWYPTKVVYDRGYVNLERYETPVQQYRLMLFESMGIIDTTLSMRVHDYWIPKTKNSALFITHHGWFLSSFSVLDYSKRAGDFDHLIFYNDTYRRIEPQESLDPLKSYWVYQELSDSVLSQFPELGVYGLEGKEILSRSFYNNSDWSMLGYGTYPGWVVNTNGSGIYMLGYGLGSYYPLYGGLTTPKDGYWSYCNGSDVSFSVDQTEAE